MNSKNEDDEDGVNCMDDLLLKDIGTRGVKDLLTLTKLLEIEDFHDTLNLKEKIILNVTRKKSVKLKTNLYIEHTDEKNELAFEEEELRRMHLNEFLTEIESMYYHFCKVAKIRITHPEGPVDEIDDPLIIKLNNEFGTVEQQFEKKRMLVCKKLKCGLLICGDSYPDKRSFISHLVNEPLLQTSIKKNTARQIRWTHDKYERVQLVDLEGKINNILKEDFSEEVSSSSENIENDAQPIWESATFFLNKPILEDGLDIYEELTEDLEDIGGVFFLLDRKDKIEENTLAELARIVNHITTNGILGVSVHFILNMCDLPENTKDDDIEILKGILIKQIQEKLMFFCPKIIVFNKERDAYMKDNECISMNTEDVVKLIKNVHLNSFTTITLSIFEFLWRFVGRAIAYINESETFAASDRIGKRNYIKKFERLESECKLLNQLFNKQNEWLLKDKYQIYKKEVENHLLNIEETKVRIVSEVANKENILIGMTEIIKVDKEILTLTHDAILKNIKEQNIPRKVSHDMLMTFFNQFTAHQKKEYSIHKEMKGDINPSLNYNKEDPTTLYFNDLMKLTIYHEDVLQILTPMIVPEIKFVNTIKKNFGISLFTIIPKLNFYEVKRFYEDTRLYVRSRSATNYDKFIGGKDNIKMIMDSLFEKPQQVARDFVKYLADDMNYLGRNFDRLKDDVRNLETVRQTYKEIKEGLETIYNELCMFNMLYLPKEPDDIMREKIKVPSFSGQQSDSKNGAVLFNRNRLLQCGNFKDTPMKDSAVLVYRNVDGKNWKDLYQEYENHKEISKCFLSKDNLDKLNCFITIRSHILVSINDGQDHKNPMFLVNGVDHSLKTYFKEYKSSIETMKDRDRLLNSEIKRVLRQILNGLSYLHNRKLVHYDLTLDSIGYDSTFATIKLSSISVETSVKIDHSSTSRCYVHEIAHFPKEILDKNSQKKYTSKSDIYCLGIILYQLWVDIHPFFDIIENKEIDTVESFVGLLQAPQFHDMILCCLFRGGFAEMVYTWATLCWENKHTANEFYNLIERPVYYGRVSN